MVKIQHFGNIFPEILRWTKAHYIQYLHRKSWPLCKPKGRSSSTCRPFHNNITLVASFRAIESQHLGHCLKYSQLREGNAGCNRPITGGKNLDIMYILSPGKRLLSALGQNQPRYSQLREGNTGCNRPTTEGKNLDIMCRILKTTLG